MHRGIYEKSLGDGKPTHYGDNRLRKPKYMKKGVIHLVHDWPGVKKINPQFIKSLCDDLMTRGKGPLYGRVAAGTHICKNCLRSVNSAIRELASDLVYRIMQVMEKDDVSLQALQWGGTFYYGIVAQSTDTPGEVRFRFKAEGQLWSIELQLLEPDTWTWANTADDVTLAKWIGDKLAEQVILGRITPGTESYMEEMLDGLFELDSPQ